MFSLLIFGSNTQTVCNCLAQYKTNVFPKPLRAVLCNLPFAPRKAAFGWRGAPRGRFCNFGTKSAWSLTLSRVTYPDRLQLPCKICCHQICKAAENVRCTLFISAKGWLFCQKGGRRASERSHASTPQVHWR